MVKYQRPTLTMYIAYPLYRKDFLAVDYPWKFNEVRTQKFLTDVKMGGHEMVGHYLSGHNYGR